MKSKWTIVKLGEIVFEERLPVGTFDGNGLPVLGVTNVDGVTHTGVTASEDLSKYLRLKPGRFVYNPYRINVGSLGLSSETQDGITSPAYVVFGPRERIEAKYLHYFLKSARGSQLINYYGNRGTVRSALRFNDLCQIEIPLPPLAEQRRIVAGIDELAAKIHEARTLRQQTAEASETLLGSAIIAAIASVDIKVAENLSPLKSVCEMITDGAHNTPAYVDEGVPLLTAKNVFWDRIDNLNVRYISREDHEQIFRRCPVRRGDVLFINIGATTGTARKVDIDLEFSVKNVAMLRAAPQLLDADFLLYMLRGPRVRGEIAKLQAQTCQQFLSLRDIRNLKIPVPPINEQRRIVAELDALETQVDSLKRLQTETAAELDALLPSILDRAFKGEL